MRVKVVRKKRSSLLARAPVADHGVHEALQEPSLLVPVSEPRRASYRSRRASASAVPVLFPICAMAPRKRLKAFVLRTSCCSSKEEYDLFLQRNRHQLI